MPVPSLLRTLWLCALLLLLVTPCRGNNLNIIPAPRSIEATGDTFVLPADATIGATSDELLPAARYLATLMRPATGYPLPTRVGTGTVTLTLGNVEGNPGAYLLEVTPAGVTVTGRDYSGVIAGIQSLRQLLPVQIESKIPMTTVAWNIPTVRIEDAPAYPWRGLHLDVSRHFFTTDEVKELLDLMALYKLNRFHWHLTDDQGWRVEIKRYPLLTQKGAWRHFNDQDLGCLSLAESRDNPDFLLPQARMHVEEGDTLYGGYYTQRQIRDVVNYARERGIEIVPEIDMPGHMLAAISNYEGVSCFPQIGWGHTFTSPVCPGKDSALEFCMNVYDELCDLFPYEYVHIGGDEVEKDNWLKCPDCQARMRQEGLQDVEELHAWFIHRMEEFINSKGKKMIGWDEIIEGGLSPTSTVMWWRSWCPDAPELTAGHGNSLICTPNSAFYLDYDEDPSSLEKIYDFDMTAGLPVERQHLVLGAQGNIWCEWIPTRERMHYKAAPRMLAISELAWTPASRKDYSDFSHRLPAHFERMNLMGVNYRIPDLQGFAQTNSFIDRGELKVQCADPTATVRYTTDSTLPTATSTLYAAPVPVTENTDFTLAPFGPDGRRGDVVRTRFVRDSYTPTTANAPATPGLTAAWHDFRGERCADIPNAPLKGTYTTSAVEIPDGVRGNIGLVITGYIVVPQDDIYTFTLLSDDGSTLTIDGAMVIDNDGAHSPRSMDAQKALAAGAHPIEVRYFDSNGGILRLTLLDSHGRPVTPAFTH